MTPLTRIQRLTTQPTALLLDLDGTLTDPKLGITRCIQHALTQLGEPVPTADELEWCIGPPLPVSFVQLLQTDEAARVNQAVRFYRERFAREGLFENTLYQDTLPALARLQQHGIPLFLATSKPWVYARQILDHFALSPYFSAVYGSELDESRADKGELIAHILEQEQLAAATTLMAGDRRYDVEGGKKNGLLTVALRHGYGSHAELHASAPDAILDNMTALAAVVTGQT